MCVIGTQEQQNIIGVIMIAGDEISSSMLKEVPSLEYYNPKKFYKNNQQDVEVIRDFWSAKEGENLQSLDRANTEVLMQIYHYICQFWVIEIYCIYYEWKLRPQLIQISFF